MDKQMNIMQGKKKKILLRIFISILIQAVILLNWQVGYSEISIDQNLVNKTTLASPLSINTIPVQVAFERKLIELLSTTQTSNSEAERSTSLNTKKMRVNNNSYFAELVYLNAKSLLKKISLPRDWIITTVIFFLVLLLFSQRVATSHASEPIVTNIVELRNAILDSGIGLPYFKRIQEIQDDSHRRGMQFSSTYRYLHWKEQELKKLRKTIPTYQHQLTPRITIARNIKQLIDIKLKDNPPYVIMRFKDQPIFYVRFINNAAQGLAFDRVNIFVEVKPGLIASEAELRKISFEIDLRAGGGHDYRIRDLAQFFTEAKRQKIRLNIVENRIKSELLKSSLLIEDVAGYIAVKNGAFISTGPQTSKAEIDHELNHAIYFTDETYQDASRQLWNRLTAPENIFIKNILSGLYDYNLNDPDLLVREFIAFFRDPAELLHTYLFPLGATVLNFRKDHRLYNLRTYYNSQGNLKSTVVTSIEKLSKIVHSINSSSSVYRGLSDSMSNETKTSEEINNVQQLTDAGTLSLYDNLSCVDQRNTIEQAI